VYFNELEIITKLNFVILLLGQLKTVLDRNRTLIAKNANIFKDKIGTALAVGGIDLVVKKLLFGVF